jgi:SUMO ligase MMS21 Smc5/6 complex component
VLKKRNVSGKCSHHYERTAIENYLQQTAKKRKGTSVQCPVSGCDQLFSKQDLTDDSEFLYRLQRFFKLQASQPLSQGVDLEAVNEGMTEL